MARSALAFPFAWRSLLVTSHSYVFSWNYLSNALLTNIKHHPPPVTMEIPFLLIKPPNATDWTSCLWWGHRTGFFMDMLEEERTFPQQWCLEPQKELADCQTRPSEIVVRWNLPIQSSAGNQVWKRNHRNLGFIGCVGLKVTHSSTDSTFKTTYL